MWLNNILSHLLTILTLHFYLSKIVNASSSDEFIVISDKENNSENVQPGCLCPELNQNMNHLQKFIQKEMSRIEKNIVEKLRYESEKLSGKINQNSNKLSSIVSDLNKKMYDISIKIQDVQTITKDNRIKLVALENSTANNTNTLNSLPTSQQTLQFIRKTCFEAIKHATDTNYEILSKINNNTLEIVKSFNRVVNISCDTSSTFNERKNITNNSNVETINKIVPKLVNNNNSEIVQVTTSTEMPPNELQEWDWSRCKEERFPDMRILANERFHPLSAAAGVGGGGKKLRLAVRGDGWVYFYLSREPQFDYSQGIYFEIHIGKTYSYVYLVDAGVFNNIQQVSVGTSLSYSWDTRVLLTIDDGSLEVRVGDSSTPLLAARDPRLGQVKYFGFYTYGNSQGHAIFKYGC